MVAYATSVCPLQTVAQAQVRPAPVSAGWLQLQQQQPAAAGQEHRGPGHRHRRGHRRGRGAGRGGGGGGHGPLQGLRQVIPRPEDLPAARGTLQGARRSAAGVSRQFCR